MKRVVFITAFGVPRKGGVERYSFELAKRLVGAGHEVTIVTCNTESAPAQEDINGVRYVRIPAWVVADRQYPVPKPGRELVRALSALRAGRPDLVATSTRFYVTSLLAYFIARWLRRPFVHIEHGSRTFTGPNKLVNVFAWLVDVTWGRWVIRRADVLFAVSDDVRRFVAKLGGREDAQLLPVRVDADMFRPDQALRSVWRQRLGASEDAVVIAFCGRLVPTKGTRELIDAFRSLADEKVLLAIAGTGPDAGVFADEPAVVQLGELDDVGIVGLLNAADIFVNPSHSEGMPSTVLEAGAVGVATIATDVGGTREIVTGPDAGILVPSEDAGALGEALAELVDDPQRRRDLATTIRNVVLERYAWRPGAIDPFVGAT